MELNTTVTTGVGNQVIVPRKLYNKLRLQRGEYLRVEQHGRQLVLKPEDSERKEILEAVAQGRVDYKAGGSYGPFDTAEEMIKSLHKEARQIRVERRKAKHSKK